MPGTSKASGPLSNSAAQAQAREIRKQLGAYVNFRDGRMQEAFPDWRDRSRRCLERAGEMLAKLRAADARTGLLPDGLRDTAFERARCREVEGEFVISARRRGSAAECAADLAEVLRDGDLPMARTLFRELAGNMVRLP